MVALDTDGAAEGVLYLDDEITRAHERDGAFAYRQFSFSSTSSSSIGSLAAAAATSPGGAADLSPSGWGFDVTKGPDPAYASSLSPRVERVVVVGVAEGKTPSKAVITEDGEVRYDRL